MLRTIPQIVPAPVEVRPVAGSGNHEFDIHFSPAICAGYILPKIADADGFYLDNDRNGLPAEQQYDVHRLDFRSPDPGDVLDDIPPRASRQISFPTSPPLGGSGPFIPDPDILNPSLGDVLNPSLGSTTLSGAVGGLAR